MDRVQQSHKYEAFENTESFVSFSWKKLITYSYTRQFLK